jgi:formate/nitrite transporter FocA (FNT family)
VIYAFLLTISLTMDGTATELNPVAAKLVAIGETKVNSYAAAGVAGYITVLTKGILCNWMVSLGVVVAFTSQSTVGKIFAIWGPVVLFFSQGWEHTVVNMFVIPFSLMNGGHFTIPEWWFWNQIPATIGNWIGGMFFTGMALYMTHRAPKPAGEAVAQAVPQMAQPR